MHPPRRYSPAAHIALLAVLGLLSGCGQPADQTETAKKLRTIGDLYGSYASSHGNKGPSNEKEFRKHIRGLPPLAQSGHGIDPNKLDELFTSPRDQQPFQIRYGVSITDLGKDAPVLAHEQTGAHGKRLVVFASGRVEEMDEEKLHQVIGGKSP